MVQDLIDTTSRMKEQLGPTLIRETQLRMEEREVTGTTREIEGELDWVSDEHTHTEVARLNGGELAQRVETRCGQLGVILREQREMLCSLEAGLDQAGSVVPGGVEGTSEANGCTRSLGVWRPRELLWWRESTV